MRALVLDGNENQAVASTRSLARAGHRVLVGAESAWSKAGWSRLADRSFVYPSPQHDPEGFVAALAAEASREAGTLILPMTERSMLPISERRDVLLGAGARLVLPKHEAVLRAFDKRETTTLARSLGITVPRTLVLDARVAPNRFALPYPVVLKPHTSEERGETGSTRTTGAPVYASSAEEFDRAWTHVRERSGHVLVQEFIDGVGSGYFALVDRGRVRAEFAHRRIRDVRPAGSGSALRVSVDVDPRIAAGSRRLLDALNWHGVAMVEYRVRPDGTPVFMEVNGRFWNSLALAIHAGVDFPALLAELAETGRIANTPAARSGVRCRWLLGDVRHLAEVMRGAPAGYPRRFPSRVRTLIDVLTPRPGTWHDNFELRDPWPEAGDWLHFITRKMPGAVRRPVTAARAQHA
jgi:predicted ATP-grasp superfamily ATP-dependent carboligase